MSSITSMNFQGMNQMKNFIVRSLSIFFLSLFLAGQTQAFGLGEIAKEVAGRVATQKATDAAVDALTDEDTPEFEKQQVSLADAPDIKEAPLAVSLKAVSGKVGLFSARPKIAIGGYNIGAYLTDKVTSRTYAGDGAKVSMNLQLEGVDAAMLTRIADAGHADLIAKLRAAGIDVIDAPSFFQSPEAQEIKRSAEPVEGGTPKKILLVGPKGVGAALTPYSLITKGFNANIGDQASSALDAIVIYPNVALDFAWTSGSGSSMFNRKVNVEGGMRFALDQTSNCWGVYSKDGRFVDGSIMLTPEEDIGVDDAFATLGQAESRDNGLAVGLSHALKLGMGSNTGDSYIVAADKGRYELLAMNAVKGFNQELVRNIKIAKGL